MSRDLPIQVIRAMRSEEAEDALVWLLRINGASGTTRYANYDSAVVGPTEAGQSGDQSYAPFPFTVTLPPQTGDQAPRLEVTANDVALSVTTTLLQEVDELTADIYAVQIGVFEDGSTTRHLPIAAYEGFVVRNAVSDERSVGFTLTLEHFFDEPIGIWRMDADVAPWLY